jgi:hypothetical protein
LASLAIETSFNVTFNEGGVNDLICVGDEQLVTRRVAGGKLTVKLGVYLKYIEIM